MEKRTRKSAKLIDSGDKKATSKDTAYEKTKLKYPPWNSPNP
jgi:hypothetical protein